MFYDLDTELSYQCDPGYKRKGFQVAQCFFYNGTARWFGPDLTCHPIDCGPPEEILNGKRTGDCTTYRCQVIKANVFLFSFLFSTVTIIAGIAIIAGTVTSNAFRLKNTMYITTIYIITQKCFILTPLYAYD